MGGKSDCEGRLKAKKGRAVRSFLLYSFFWKFQGRMAQQQNKVSIVDILKWDKEDGGRGLVKKLQFFGAIPDSKECANCLKPMTLQKDGRGGFKWRCSKKDAATGQRCYYGIFLLAGTQFKNRNILMRVICICTNRIYKTTASVSLFLVKTMLLA